MPHPLTSGLLAFGAAALLALLLAGACADDGPAGTAGPDGGDYGLEPPSEFWDPVAEDVMLFEMKGRINPVDVSSADLKLGLGEFTAETDTVNTCMREDPYSYIKQYPTDVSDTSLAGNEYVVLTAYEQVESSAKSAEFYHTRVGLLVGDLLAAKQDGANEIPAGGAFIEVNDWTVHIKLNGERLDRVCPVAVRDQAVTVSKLFVDHVDNVGFDQGETIKAWGNVGLSDDQEAIAASDPALELHDGMYCEFMLDHEPITAAEYEAELADDTSTLSCDLPEGYLDPVADNYLAFTFRGEINDEDTQILVYGAMEIDAEVDGDSFGVGIYSAEANLAGGDAPGAAVAVGALSDVVNVSADQFTCVSTYVVLEREVLQQARAGETHAIPISSVYFAYVSEVGLVYDGDDVAHLKFCPRGIIDSDDPESSLFVCFEDNDSFDVGEDLELAGSMALTSDPETIAEFYTFYPGQECYCEEYGVQASCDTFPQE
jgi:hypothetical protein